MNLLIEHSGCIALFIACYLLFRHLYETKEIRRKQRETKRIQALLPKVKILK